MTERSPLLRPDPNNLGCLCSRNGLPYRLCPVHGIDKGTTPLPPLPRAWEVAGTREISPAEQQVLERIGDALQPADPHAPEPTFRTVSVPVEVCCCGAQRRPHPRGAGRCTR